MPRKRLLQPYADASREELLDKLGYLLQEQEAWALQIAALHIEVAEQRMTGWHRGFEWGWRSCLRDSGKGK